MDNKEIGYFEHYIGTMCGVMRKAHDTFVSGLTVFNIYTALYLLLMMVVFWKYSPTSFIIPSIAIGFTFFAVLHLNAVEGKIKFYGDVYKAKLGVISHYTQEQRIYDFYGAESVKTLKSEVDNPIMIDIRLLIFMRYMIMIVGLAPLAIYLFK